MKKSKSKIFSSVAYGNIMVWLVIMALYSFISFGCKVNSTTPTKDFTASEILGNPDYQAISFGAYKHNTRDIQPTIKELKEDLQLLHAMDIRLLRTYNVELAQTSNLLKAIKEIKESDASFEMYLMLGAWINCKNAFSASPDHSGEDSKANEAEIQRAVNLAKAYPDIVKILAVGNEAMVKWAASYFVQPGVILKYVNYLQDLKIKGELSEDLWITTSDNFASWGGGSSEYHVEDLTSLIKAVDYISMHTYPMHDTHYNPEFWGVSKEETNLSDDEKIRAAMGRALAYAQKQYEDTERYIKSLGVNKPLHIGETGWASFSNQLYGSNGSKATDEYKQGIYYQLVRDWTNTAKISCFFFEAFDEPWKDANNPGGSENHFGVFDVQGRAKYAIWKQVDNEEFNGLSRGGNPIIKTFNGDLESMLRSVQLPPVNEKLVNP